ncbi:hypothetical protein B0H10DRAFT_1950060 [Mycena sp. CBHHK59/15]|nr:hypothetical protein B0H10DRAFT_1950060 [Mycena sp. CBHHK59/15]
MPARRTVKLLRDVSLAPRIPSPRQQGPKKERKNAVCDSRREVSAKEPRDERRSAQHNDPSASPVCLDCARLSGRYKGQGQDSSRKASSSPGVSENNGGKDETSTEWQSKGRGIVRRRATRPDVGCARMVHRVANLDMAPGGAAAPGAVDVMGQ